MRTRSWRSLAALAAGVLSACGGGGGGSAPAAYDLTGYWQLFLTPNGSPAEVGPLPVYFEQTGSTFGGVDVSGAMNGTTIALTASGGVFQVALNGVATSANAAFGTVAFSGGISGGISGSGTFRLERFLPAGTMDATGTIDGIAVDASSTSAIGVRSYSDQGLTTLTAVTVVLADADLDLQLEFLPGGLAVGAQSVPPPLSAEILLRVDGSVVDALASGSTVTISSYDANGIAGTYSPTTSVGTPTGSSDVTFDIEEHDP